MELTTMSVHALSERVEELEQQLAAAEAKKQEAFEHANRHLREKMRAQEALERVRSDRNKLASAATMVVSNWDIFEIQDTTARQVFGSSIGWLRAALTTPAPKLVYDSIWELEVENGTAVATMEALATQVRELQQQLAAKDEALRDAQHFTTQIDPVHWPSRQEARKIIATIRNALASPAAEPVPQHKLDGLLRQIELQENQINELQARVNLVKRHNGEDFWYWQNDGEDHLESMASDLPVVIRADHLRALIAQPAPATEPTLAGRIQALAEKWKSHSGDSADVIRRLGHELALACCPSFEDQETQVQIRHNGKIYSCYCGGNVFTKHSDGLYTCNACDIEHRGHKQPAPVAQSEQPSLDLVAHLRRQIEFSERTFGPGTRTMGVLDHIRKELKEIESDPADLSEWVDVVILAFDGAWRAGHTAEQIAAAIVAKQTKNEGRQWPDWRTADPNKAIEHDRSGEPAIKGCHGCKHGGRDPDGPYCAHPLSMAQSSFGLSLDSAVREHCTKDRLNWEAPVAQSQEGEQ